ncbi:MAG: SafA/ExsA family spore coat assembly protein [Bacteroidales bacterium]|nr:SafA/ExsA family spore coat assembly protein [Bacteroidales bacterium]
MKYIIAALLFAFPVSAQAATHTVQSGDTMWKIAVRYQVGCQEIIDANSQVSNPNLIYPGQKLNIPVQERAYEQEVLDLVNAERAKTGVAPVKLNWELSRVARFKSEDMLNSGYFSHTSPTYGSPFKMMNDFGIRYNSAAENIAKGQRSSSEVMDAWMNSSGHRSNILNGKYTEMGIGKAGNYWTQMFKD